MLAEGHEGAEGTEAQRRDTPATRTWAREAEKGQRIEYSEVKVGPDCLDLRNSRLRRRPGPNHIHSQPKRSTEVSGLAHRNVPKLILGAEECSENN